MGNLADLQRALFGTDYQPNLSDPRVKRRVAQVLDDLFPHLGREGLRWGTDRLDDIFGSRNNDLPNFLRAVLLTRLRGHRPSRKESAIFKVNEAGFELLWPQVHNELFDYQKIRGRWWQQRFEPYLNGKVVEYTQREPDQRRYAKDNLQLLPNDLKPVILHGHYDYDISTCMGSLVLQEAWTLDQTGYEFKRLQDYVNNKRTWRDWTAQRFEISIAEAKELLQLMFSLAELKPSPYLRVFTLVGRSKPNFRVLQLDPWLAGLRADAEMAWKTLCQQNWDDGAERFRVYERLERRVMSVIERHLDQEGTHYLNSHDGWCNLTLGVRSDVDHLARCVKDETGYQVIIEETARYDYASEDQLVGS